MQTNVLVSTYRRYYPTAGPVRRWSRSTYHPISLKTLPERGGNDFFFHRRLVSTFRADPPRKKRAAHTHRLARFRANEQCLQSFQQDFEQLKLQFRLMLEESPFADYKAIRDSIHRQHSMVKVNAAFAGFGKQTKNAHSSSPFRVWQMFTPPKHAEPSWTQSTSCRLNRAKTSGRR